MEQERTPTATAPPTRARRRMLQRRRRTVRVVLVGVVSLALVAGVALGVLQ